MEYVLMNERREGGRTVKDFASLKDNLWKHFQVEVRNGLVFMRMKSRKLQDPSRNA